MTHAPTTALVLPDSGHYVAVLRTDRGDVVEHEEGWFDVASAGRLAVRATSGGVPRFETTVHVQHDRWRRAERRRDAERAWHHDAPGRAPLHPLPDADLLTIVGIMGDPVQSALGCPAEASAEVPIQVRTCDGVLAGWSVEVDDLVGVARSLGCEPEPWLTTGSLTYEVVIDDPGVPVTITRPARA